LKSLTNELKGKVCEVKFENLKFIKAKWLLKFNSLPNKIITINNYDEFKKILKDFPNTIVVINFWSNFCSSCKTFSFIFDSVQHEYSRDFIFIKINIDENPMIDKNFGITSIPTTLLIKGDLVIRKFGGFLDYNTVKLILENFKT
jgi:thioredoxin 1